jgi:excisionase family DNA binding protein
MDNMELITITEAAKFLKVHPDTVRKHITHIPHMRIGKQIRINKQKLLEWAQESMSQEGDE